MALVSVSSNNQSLSDQFYTLVKKPEGYSVSDTSNATKIILEKKLEKPSIAKPNKTSISTPNKKRPRLY